LVIFDFKLSVGLPGGFGFGVSSFVSSAVLDFYFHFNTVEKLTVMFSGAKALRVGAWDVGFDAKQVENDRFF
jgi:hypothetical protein